MIDVSVWDYVNHKISDLNPNIGFVQTAGKSDLFLTSDL